MSAKSDKQGKERGAPESEAGIISRLFFLWVLPFAYDAWTAIQENRFNAAVLPPIPAEEHPEQNIKKLRALWEKEIQTRGDKASLGRACFVMMGPALVTCFIIMSIQALLLMSGPLMVSKLVQAIQGIVPPSVGFLMCGLLTLSTAVASVLQQGSWHICSRSARQNWLALSGLIFEKPARMSSGARGDITEGELVNMMAVDAQQVLNFMQFFAIFASAPMYIIVPSIIIPMVLGWPYLVGLCIFAATSFACDRIAVKTKNHQAGKLKAADKRNLRLNESFQGIRTVKLNAWESLMEQRVEEERAVEMKELRYFHIWQSLQQALAFGMPTIGTVLTFLIYGATGGTFEPSLVFLCVGLFEFLTLGTSILPAMFNMIRQLRLNMQRMQKLLIKTEDFTSCSTGKTLPAGTVRCVGADFAWALPKAGEQAAPTLTGMTLEASPGEMVAVCGRVGAGKSTWAGGLLGLVSKTKGELSINGTVAYVTQSSQILNDTVKENILFGSDMDENWYAQVLKACSLEDDIKQFTAGDLTEIGERGITISGGQKQRVAIARAAYSRADIIVFDDPLSAMDAHVGKLVFDNCFRTLLGKTTRIFFTNQLNFCSSCSKVYMLENGRIAEAGPYRQLASRTPPGPFAVFLQSVVGSSVEEDEVVDPVLVKLELKPNAEATKPAAAAPPAAGAGDAENKKGTTMVAEKKISGRIGFKDWMQVAKASNAAVLGFFVLFTSILAPVLQFLVSALLAFWTNTLLKAEEGTGAFDNPVPAILYASSAVFLAVFLFVRGCLCVFYFLKSSRTLHRGMLRTTLRQTMGWFDTTPVGRVLNRFGNDVMLMDIMLPMLFQMWSLLFFRVLIVIIVAGITAPPALLLSVILLVTTKVIYQYYGAIALEVTRVQMMALSPLLAAQSSFLGALDSIRCFDRVDVFVRRFHTMQGDFIKTFYWSFSLDRAMQCIFTTLGVSTFFGSVGCLLLILSIYETPFSALVSPGSAGAILAYCSMLAFQAPVGLYMTARVEAMMSSVQRVAEYKSAPTEESQQKEQKEVHKLWPTKGYLSLEKVDMRYQEHLPLALKGVSFDVLAGEKVGIVGRTGSGKSSIILTCFRMINACGGKVRLDGVDTATVPLEDLRSRLGVIPQDSWLFSGTIRSNLDVYGKHTDKELWDVLRLVQLEGQAKDWKGGLEHVVSEKGDNLSMGTAQLICLARVLLKQPRLLFMDEATASVDAETDKLVQETIRKDGVLPRDCSIVTIAHRLHTVIDYDRIVVLGAGEVLENGSPVELLEKKGGHLTMLVNSTGPATSRELRRRASAGAAASRDLRLRAGVAVVEETIGPVWQEEDAAVPRKSAGLGSPKASAIYCIGCFPGFGLRE